jgi:transposase
MEHAITTPNSTEIPKALPKPKVREQVIGKIRYLYEDMPYWDTNKQQTRHKRFYIGHYIDDNIFKFSKNYLLRQKNIYLNNHQSVKLKKYSHKMVGTTYLLDQIAKNTGIYEDLKEIFPDTYLQILSLSYYITLENENTLYRFSKWAYLHSHPYQQDLPAARISELLLTINENNKIEFFKKQISRCLDSEYFAYDTTSISSYSELISQVKHGHNKDHDKLPQINLAIVFGEKSLLPVYYRLLPSNINDVTTIKRFIFDIKSFSFNSLNFVFDRDFYIKDNIEKLNANEYKFIIGVKNINSFIFTHVKDIKDELLSLKNYNNYHNIYYIMKQSFIKYNKSNILNKDQKSKFKIYIHMYYDAIKASRDKNEFLNDIKCAIDRVNDGNTTEIDKKLLIKYSSYQKSDNSNVILSLDNNLINDHCVSFGFFTIFSNNISNPIEALNIYRNKDVIEKAFNNLKNRLIFRHTSACSIECLEGLLFIQYIGLIFTSYIHRQMKQNKLYDNYTLETFLDELDIISCINKPNGDKKLDELTSKQIELYNFMNVKPITL